jgi:hypothetical protein
METRDQTRTVTSAILGPVLAGLVLGVALLYAPSAAAGPWIGEDCERPSQRPLSDFLDAQGTSSTFFPPVADYVGWADGDFITFALVDYAGLANDFIVAEGGEDLGTRSTGRVLECALPDGTARISVVLNTRKALGFAQSIQDLIDNDFDFAGTPTIFGNKAVDVADGADPAVGPARLRTSFVIEAPGADLPDWLDVINDPETYGPVTLDFRSTTVGTRPDGTPARLRVQQVGLTVGPFTREIVDIAPPEKGNDD